LCDGLVFSLFGKTKALAFAAFFVLRAQHEDQVHCLG